MIAKGALESLTVRLDARVDDWAPPLTGYTLRLLIDDARMLRELTDALPRCCSNECAHIATYMEPTYGGDFADGFHCDAHANTDPGVSHGPDQKLPYANAVRKLATAPEGGRDG